MKIIQSLLKSDRQKASLNSWIVSHFPENYETLTYLEPYSGTADVLLNKRKSTIY